ncbi:MAG: hypothetical protein ABI383_05525, partial [Acidobacteriaceae bacterium]
PNHRPPAPSNSVQPPPVSAQPPTGTTPSPESNAPPQPGGNSSNASHPSQNSYEEGGFAVAPRSAPKPGVLPEKNVEDPTDTSDLIPIPPLPPTAATLIGGFVKDVDPVNDRVTVAPFGTKRKMKVFFDERSKVYRNGREVSPTAIRKGDRIYLDTQLDKANSRIFARNVRVQTKPLQADAHGQIVSYDRQNSIMDVRDDLSDQDVKFHIQPAAIVDNQGHPGALTDLQPGTLINAHFLTGQEGRNEVNQITILAAPGSDYTFEGRVTHLDMGSHTLGLENQTDGRIYDIQFDPRRTPIGNLQVGAPVNVTATFDGNQYRADSVTEVSAADLGDLDQLSSDDLASDQSGKKSKKDKKHKKDVKTNNKGEANAEDTTPK